MENSIFTSLSRQTALQSQMNVIANNIANVNTPGFQSSNMIFREFIADPRDADDELSMVNDYGMYQNTAPGPLRKTENPLDVALVGPGYMGVERGDGTTGYTRAGSFQINVKGELVTGAGDLVSNNGGGAITIPADAREIKIDNKGVVSTENGQVGQIMIVEFENQQDLEAVGNGLYITNAAANPAENTIMNQGVLEGSNVKPVVEITRMIEVLRSYQNTQRGLQSEHERIRTMLQRLTRQG